jgi:nucleoside phosphorylase
MVAGNSQRGVMRRAVIFTALAVEFRAVREHLRDCQEEVHPQGTVYDRGLFQGKEGDWEVLLVEVGEGNARSSMEVERAIELFRPEVVLFVGVAGGLKDVSIGDVVFAPKVYGYESGKETDGFEPRPDVGEATYRLEQRARAVARHDDWLRCIQPSPPSERVRALAGPIAAGEKVLASTGSTEYQRLRKQYGDALAVEKEGRGFLVAARANPGVEALVIRGISDLIDGKAAADASGSQQLASRHASAFAFEVLSKLRLPGALVTAVQPLETKQGAGTPVWTVPYLRNSNFMGRDSLLHQIRTRLLSVSASPTLVALHGLGGVGKTHVAVEYAFRHIQEADGYANVLWTRADGHSILAAGYAALADALGLPEKNSSELSVKQEAVRRWLQQNDGWLLVFDNAEQAADLQPYLPVRGRGHIIITSRNPNWGELATPLAVDVLERSESVSFLLKRTGQTDETATHALAEALGDLPLALAQAAAYIEQTQKSLTAYRTLFDLAQATYLPAQPWRCLLAPPHYRTLYMWSDRRRERSGGTLSGKSESRLSRQTRFILVSAPR